MPDTLADKPSRWVARLTPVPGAGVEALLNVPLGLDIWERHDDALVVAATESQLAEVERRGLAHVERLSSVEDFVSRWQPPAPPPPPERSEP